MLLGTKLLICRLVAHLCSLHLTAFVMLRHFIQSTRQARGLESTTIDFDSEHEKASEDVEAFENDIILTEPLEKYKSGSPSVHHKQPTCSTTRILRAFWCSEFLFSFFGIVCTALAISKEAIVMSFTGILFTAVPHFSFKIASFYWMGVLSVYATTHKRAKLNVNVCHALIWFLLFFYWLLLLLAKQQPDSWILLYSSLIWKAVAAADFAVIFLCWVVYVARKRQTTTVSQFVVSKFGAYTICFFCFVSPNIFYEYIYGTQQQPTVIHMIFAVIFQLWPGANAIIAMQKFTCCSCFVREPLESAAYARAESRKGIDEMMSNCPLHELKGLEIGEKIGEGVAVVFLGKWRGVFVAVKMKMLMLDSSKQLAGIQSACNAEIQQEAQVMKGLSHPNIVLFMEAGFYRGAICIISEYCARGSLRDVLTTMKGKQFSWPTKIRLALGIAHGMQYLHNANPPMIHRDLKSPNVLVNESWHAKVADFGTLKFSEIVSNVKCLTNSIQCNTEANLMTGLVGTTRWMAPEVICGKKAYTSKVDIYSLGLILWELIDGQLPFEHIRWNFEIEKSVLQGSRPLISTERCPAAWRLLIISCWQTEPEHRPTIQRVIRKLQCIARDDAYVDGNSEDESLSLQTLSEQCIFRQSFNPFASSTTSCSSSFLSKSSKVVSRRRPDELENGETDVRETAAKSKSPQVIHALLERESFER